MTFNLFTKGLVGLITSGVFLVPIVYGFNQNTNSLQASYTLKNNVTESVQFAQKRYKNLKINPETEIVVEVDESSSSSSKSNKQLQAPKVVNFETEKSDFSVIDSKISDVAEASKKSEYREFADHNGSDYDYAYDEEDFKIAYEPEEIVPPSEPLKESANQVFSLNEVLPQNQILTGFSSSNIANNAQNVDINSDLTLTFPGSVSPDIHNSLRFYPEVEFDKQVIGNQIKIKPKSPLDTYTQYVFGIKGQKVCDALLTFCNGGDVWYYALRFTTNWRGSSVIGKSHEGRDIRAYFYGRQEANKPKILLTGAVHGEEWRSGALWQLMDYLNNNPNELLSRGKKMIIVPEVNVDGAAYNKSKVPEYGNQDNSFGRNNARGVNLNRNFPAHWKSCNHCGSGPASENETQAIVRLTETQKPTHLISYHAQWPPNGMIFMGNTKNPETVNFANWVAQRTGYPVGIYSGPETGQPTGGTVGGDQTVWSETVGVRSLIIEATWRANTDWDRNFPMYKALIRDL